MTHAHARSFRDILVYLSAGDNAPARLAAAIALAQQHGARLIGVEVNHPAVYDTERAPAAAELPDTFERETRMAGVDSVFHVAGREDRVGWKTLYAHYADIVIAPSASEADAHVVLRGVPEEVMLNAGVPVLVIPDLWQVQPLGKRVVVSWNASREATRAVHDTLPILARAENVTLFAFDPRNQVLEEETALIQDHLAAHGIAAEKFTWPATGDIDAVDALFSCLSEQGADLVVAGGYGHARLMERLLGGMTQSLVHTLTVPVVMSH